MAGLGFVSKSQPWKSPNKENGNFLDPFANGHDSNHSATATATTLYVSELFISLLEAWAQKKVYILWDNKTDRYKKANLAVSSLHWFFSYGFFSEVAVIIKTGNVIFCFA